MKYLPSVSLESLSSDSNDIEVGDSANFQFEGQLGKAGRVPEFAAQNVTLLLTWDALRHQGTGQLVQDVICKENNQKYVKSSKCDF